MSNPYEDGDSRHAFEWGLTSLLVAVAMFAMTPVMMLVNAYVFTQAYAEINSDDRILARVLTGAGLVVFPGIAATSFIFGMVGLISATARRQPGALPLGGAMLSAVNFFLWVGLFVHMLFILQTFQ